MMDKNREAFEAAWAKKNSSNKKEYQIRLMALSKIWFENPIKNGYFDSFVNSAWEWWQASRQAIEVALDESYDDGHGNEWLPKDSTIKALTSLGIRVKGNEE